MDFCFFRYYCHNKMVTKLNLIRGFLVFNAHLFHLLHNKGRAFSSQ